MSKSIWKYQLETTDEQLVEMPHGAQGLSVEVQYGAPCLWALVNPKAQKEFRRVRIYVTGHPVPENDDIYVGSYQLHGGSLVGHVFITPA